MLIMEIRARILWSLAICSLLFPILSYSASESTAGANTAACQPRASDRHRQGQSLRCKTRSRQLTNRETKPATVTSINSKCRPRASTRHRHSQSLGCKYGSRRSMDQETNAAPVASIDSKCQPRASERHRQGQSGRCKNR